MGSYFLFAASMRATLVGENPEMKTTEIATLTGQKWKDLSEEEKGEWKEKEAADYERYVAECEAAGVEPAAKRAKKEKAAGGGGGGEKKEKKAKRDEPKAAKSALLHYRAEHRLRVAGENPDADVGRIIEILCAEFEALDEEAKGVYVAKEAADKERFAAEMEARREEDAAAKAEAKSMKEAQKASKVAAKEMEKEAKRVAKEAAKAAKGKGKGGAKKPAKKAAKEVEREATEEEGEVLGALERMRKAGVEAEEEVHGWRLKVKARPAKEGAKAAHVDLSAAPPKSKKAKDVLHSVLAVKRHMGILSAAPAEEGKAEEGKEVVAAAEGAAAEEGVEEAEEAAEEEEEEEAAEEEEEEDEAAEEEEEEAAEDEDEVEEAAEDEDEDEEAAADEDEEDE